MKPQGLFRKFWFFLKKLNRKEGEIIGGKSSKQPD